MSASTYNFTIEQGATMEFQILWLNSNNQPISLAGYDGKMQIRSNYSGSGITYLTLTSSIGDTYAFNSGSAFLSMSGSNLVTPVTSGSIGIYAGYLLTDQLTFTGSAYYDLELTNTVTQERVRLIEGQVNISQQVTQ